MASKQQHTPKSLRLQASGKAGAPGDWMPAKESKLVPEVAVAKLFDIPDVDAIYEDMKKQPDPYVEAVKAIESGKEKVFDAVLFCGRFNRDGMLDRKLSESDRKVGLKPYRMVRVQGSQYKKAQESAKKAYTSLITKLNEAAAKKFKGKVKEDMGLLSAGWGAGGAASPLYSNSDLGSNQFLDPNQFTEFTPWFSGPFYKNLPYAYFPGMAASREAVNHHPVAKRIVDLLCQYALGRGFDIRCKNKKISDTWLKFQKQIKLKKKLRKFWAREYLTDGELYVDVLRMVTVDASTIMDIVCEGFGEYIDKVLYYQQMYQTATQTFAGLQVPGVAGSQDSTPGQWVIRQIPYDQIIHIKTNCTSQEKRGRPIIFSILGWLKKLKDTYTGQVLAEQLQSAFVYDDTVKGSATDVASHAAKYTYIPVAPSIFVHNEAVERKPLNPVGSSKGSQSTVAQEILALCATSMGFPKDFFNVMSSGSGSRATAIVGSEPFTKVIEDLQQDFEDLLDQIIAVFCKQNGFEYKEEEWQIIFPSVTKDTTADVIKNVSTAEAAGYFSHRRAATMVASEMEADNYEYDQEMQDKQKDGLKFPQTGMPGALPPAGRFGQPQKPEPQEEEDGQESPLHGKEKGKIKKQHKEL